MLYNYNPKRAKKAHVVLSDGRKADGEFLEERISVESLPKGFIWYQIRHSDFDWGEAASMKQSQCVAVNFFGTFISQTDLQLKDETDITDFIID